MVAFLSFHTSFGVPDQIVTMSLYSNQSITAPFSNTCTLMYNTQYTGNNYTKLYLGHCTNFLYQNRTHNTAQYTQHTADNRFYLRPAIQHTMPTPSSGPSVSSNTHHRRKKRLKSADSLNRNDKKSIRTATMMVSPALI